MLLIILNFYNNNHFLYEFMNNCLFYHLISFSLNIACDKSICAKVNYYMDFISSILGFLFGFSLECHGELTCQLTLLAVWCAHAVDNLPCGIRPGILGLDC